MAALTAAQVLTPIVVLMDRPPAVSDDQTGGFREGMIWIDRSAYPRDAYLCADAARSAATWRKMP